MNPVIEVLFFVLIALGLFFMFIGPLGLIRMPDFYTRAHASGKCDSLGEGLLLLGFILYEGFTFNMVKLVFLILFIYILTPTATYAIVRAAYVIGLKPWKVGDERR
ncbi:cation:proton antiporter [Methanoculleus sp. FWC-SCC1]|uniref:Cation:proton antiporter n=1 Tax=Methanoculleus frigidifontis TaxID=2584085 RepID=A0ABT8M848_9EURY|nr:monovalent cation/H(+) antiporter subunit G [Methanoculleus sp. FWC-SCC1]MDN7024091.1 cation:proton antiporter [Methanoculleus sp. FWC-SCC1]